MTAVRRDRCRHCGREPVDAHRADCPLSPDEPLPDDLPDDTGGRGAAEDAYEQTQTGERPW